MLKFHSPSNSIRLLNNNKKQRAQSSNKKKEEEEEKKEEKKKNKYNQERFYLLQNKFHSSINSIRLFTKTNIIISLFKLLRGEFFYYRNRII